MAEGWFDAAGLAGLTADDDGRVVTARLDLDAPASRAAVWITADLAPEIWVQPGWSNGQAGPWRAMPVVWSEGGSTIVALDLDTAASNLRFRIDSVHGVSSLWWTAVVPVSADARSSELPHPAGDANVLEWGAAPARCGATDASGTSVLIYREPRPDAAGTPELLRVKQAFNQLGRRWCDVRPSYFVDGESAWQGRAPRRAAIGDGADAGRVAVAVVGCDDAARTELTALLDVLTDQLGLTDASQLVTRDDGLCADAPWLVDAVAEWAATDPCAPDPPPPPPRPTLAGTVVEANGAAIDGAAVVCDCGAMSRTNSLGVFSMSVVAGTHQVTVTKPGFVERTLSVDASMDVMITVALEAEPPPAGISVIDHSLLITRFGGTDADPMTFAETQDGFQEYLDAVGVTHFAAWEYVVPNNTAVADRCGFDILLPERSWWRKAAALGLLADQLRRLVNEPVTLRNWWRPPCYNEAVGGAANGDHPDGDALDLDFRSARSRADAQRHLCEQYWSRDLLEPHEIAEGSGLNPRLNLSVGLGGATIHLGLLSRNGRRFWRYSSYSNQSNSGGCW